MCLKHETSTNLDFVLSTQVLVVYTCLLAARPSACSLLCPTFAHSHSLFHTFLVKSELHSGLARLGAPAGTTGRRSREHSGGDRWWLQMARRGPCVVGGKGRGKEKLEGSRR